MKKILKISGQIMEDLSIVLLVILFLSVFAQIIMRNFFSTGSVILEELARLCLVSLVFMMIPVLFLDKQQIIVDILIARVSPKIRRVMELIVHFLSSALTVFLLVAISQVMKRNWNVRTPAIRMPNIIFYIPIVLGLVCTLGACVYHFVVILANKEAGK
jgi:TRAP-type C4-dicarboxylate transport system permease small subunit